MSKKPQNRQLSKLKPSLILVIVVHAVFLLFWGCILASALVSFGDVYKDFNIPIPVYTQFLLDLLRFSKRFPPVIVIFAAGALWLDAKLYSYLYRRFGRWAGLLWFWGLVALAPLLLGVVLLLSLFGPRFG
ncbi:MAG: hypothetical protein HY796_07045 [Elusimicrobia bacterium]|nr:hypothetical protein [Elusimicrobiota bacterium]